MTWVRALLRVAAVSAMVALVILSWLPKEMEVRTTFPGQIEHVVAYFGAAVAMTLGWPMVRTRWMVIGFVAVAAILEVGQIWVPGRTSQLVDFLASALGATTALWAAHAALHQRNGQKPEP